MVVTTTYNSSKKENGKQFSSYHQVNRLLLDSAIDDSGKFNYKRLFEYDASGNLTKKRYVEEGDTSVTRYEYGHDTVMVYYTNPKNKDLNYKELRLLKKNQNDSLVYRYLSKK